MADEDRLFEGEGDCSPSQAAIELWRALEADAELIAARGPLNDSIGPFFESSFAEGSEELRLDALSALIRGQDAAAPCRSGCWMMTCTCISDGDWHGACYRCGAERPRRECARIPRNGSGWSGCFCSWVHAAEAARDMGGSSVARLWRVRRMALVDGRPLSDEELDRIGRL